MMHSGKLTCKHSAALQCGEHIRRHYVITTPSPRSPEWALCGKLFGVAFYLSCAPCSWLSNTSRFAH